jgi:hypothetical protein
MCEWTKKMAQFHSQGIYNGGSFNGHVAPGACADCGQQLSVDDMWPHGRMSRSLCTSCYNTRIFGDTHVCQECRVNKITHKIPNQHAQPREMRHRLCDDVSCKASYALRHTVVTGRSREECIVHGQQAQISYQQPPPQIQYNMSTPRHSMVGYGGYGQQSVTAQEVALVQKALAAYENRYNYDTLPAETIVAVIIQQIRRDPSFFDPDVMDVEWVDNVRRLPPPPQLTVDELLQSVRRRRPQAAKARYVELPKKSRAHRNGAVYVELPKKKGKKLGFLR